MRIREIIFNNVRAFRGEHRISFVDQLTDQASPISVIAGTNGTGKTTILETIQELLRAFINHKLTQHLLLTEISQSSDHFIQMVLELSPADLGVSVGSSVEYINIFVGNVPESTYQETPHYFGFRQNAILASDSGSQLRGFLNDKHNDMLNGSAEPRGGLIYFPQTRLPFSPSIKGGPVESQPQHFEWLSQVDSPNQWKGSLEALWVWQNYLDLEAGAKNGGGYNNHINLRPFIESSEEALSRQREITILKGRVLVQTNWQNNGEAAWVRLDQLPSGEQQLLFLLGELTRRCRPGGIIAIDEPETSLHPTMQRRLVHEVRKFARTWDCQVILATHSLEVLREVHQSARIFLDLLNRPAKASRPQLQEAA